MYLSCCTWALADPVETALAHLAASGFTWIDTRPHVLDPQLGPPPNGLRCSCVAAAFGLEPGDDLASPDPAAAQRAAAYVADALAYSAAIGAATAYLVPGKEADGNTLKRYAAALAPLAERAAQLQVRLCLEHFPGTPLPTVAATLDFIAAVDHDNLFLLFDIGHAQMSAEDPSRALEAAGPRLGYVHLDDNDGQQDLHLGLTDGILTETILARTFQTLADLDYSGGLSLELSPNLADPLAALRQSRALVAAMAAWAREAV